MLHGQKLQSCLYIGLLKVLKCLDIGGKSALNCKKVSRLYIGLLKVLKCLDTGGKSALNCKKFYIGITHQAYWHA